MQDDKIIWCGVKSEFVNLDFTSHNITQKAVQNGNDISQADKERSRPNYLTRERCGKNRGCTPCDKNLAEASADGCFVPETTGSQDWSGPCCSYAPIDSEQIKRLCPIQRYLSARMLCRSL